MENPYATPKSEPEELVILDKPKSVNLGVIILSLSYIIAILISLISPNSAQQSLPYTTIVIIMLCSASIMFFFIYKIYRGRNWARIIFTVFYIFGVINLIISAMLSGLPLSEIFIASIQTVIQGVAVFMLFTKNANDWFKYIKFNK